MMVNENKSKIAKEDFKAFAVILTLFVLFPLAAAISILGLIFAWTVFSVILAILLTAFAILVLVFVVSYLYFKLKELRSKRSTLS